MGLAIRSLSCPSPLSGLRGGAGRGGDARDPTTMIPEAKRIVARTAAFGASRPAEPSWPNDRLSPRSGPVEWIQASELDQEVALRERRLSNARRLRLPQIAYGSFPKRAVTY